MGAGWAEVAAILGGIVLIGNAGAVVFKWLRPAMNVKRDVEQLQRDVAHMREHEKKDLETLKTIKDMNKMQSRAMLDIVNHMIDGNHVEQMKKTRDDITEMLTRI